MIDGLMNQQLWTKTIGLIALGVSTWALSCIYTPWAIKNVAFFFCQYLRQLLTNFENSFTGNLQTFCNI